MLKLMKMEVIENRFDNDIVFIEFEYQTDKNDTITFGLDLKYKGIHDLKIEGIIGVDVLEEIESLIEDNTITIYYSDYSELEEF